MLQLQQYLYILERKIKLNKRAYLIFIFSICILAYFFTGLRGEQPAEDLEIVASFGADIKKMPGDQVLFTAPSSVYNFEEGEKISSSLRTGDALTPGKTRESRQLISNKQYGLGLEKVYLIGESMATYGLKFPIEIFFRNPYLNDSGYLAICHGNPEEILNFKVQGYPSSADYIEGMLKNAHNYNFFSTDYKIADIFLSLDSEGRSPKIPYIELSDNKLKITGMCIFKKDKMIGKLNNEDTKILNMLSETDGKGVISLQAGVNDYLEYYSKVKRKVKVQKVDNKYKFIITLNFTGDIISDTLYTKEQNDAYLNNKIQSQLEEAIKNSSNYFIEKMKKQYKVDLLELGKYAAAKYGRQTGVDWDDIISNSDIDINIKVKIDRIGRGDYLFKSVKVSK